MVTTRLDGGVDSRSEFVNVAEWVTGLREPPGEIGHDQHAILDLAVQVEGVVGAPHDRVSF
jgi:hypothetical protein